jgi:hypothetical protein
MDQCSSSEVARGKDYALMKCSKGEEGGEAEIERSTVELSDKILVAVNNHSISHSIMSPMKKQKRERNHSSSSSNGNSSCGRGGDSPSPSPLLPNKVTFDPIRKLFRLRKSRGKTLAAGGFGVSVRISLEEQQADEEEDREEQVEQSQQQQTTHLNTKNLSRRDDIDKAIHMENGHHNGVTPTCLNGTNRPLDEDDENTEIRIIRKEFLFVEEVIFLYERGLMDVHDENNVRLNDTPYLIYNFLERLGLSLPLYLVYAHARQQSYRVVRHGTATRHEILRNMEQLKQAWANSASSSSSSSLSSVAIPVAEAEPVTQTNAEVSAMRAVAAVAVSQRGPSPPQSQDGNGTKDLANESTIAKTTGESATKEELDHGIAESILRERDRYDEHHVTTPDGMPLFLRSMKLLEQRLRDEVAPPPKAAFLSSSSSSSSTCNEEDNNTRMLPPLAWDVYLPDVTFQRSRPGLPAFSILVTHYAAAGASSRRACFAQSFGAADGEDGNKSSSYFLSFSQMQALALAYRPVPIKIATVSDSGTVVVFGVCAPSSSGDDNDDALVPSIAGKDSTIAPKTEKAVS